MSTRDLYQDGRLDALTEAETEIRAAFINGYDDIKRRQFDTDADFWREIALRALNDLYKSYIDDHAFMVAYRLKHGQDAI